MGIVGPVGLDSLYIYIISVRRLRDYLIGFWGLRARRGFGANLCCTLILSYELSRNLSFFFLGEGGGALQLHTLANACKKDLILKKVKHLGVRNLRNKHISVCTST